jgi:hypothetical protein
LRVFIKDYLRCYALLENNFSFIIFDNDGEKTTFRQEYVNFSSSFINEAFIVRFLSDLRQVMIATAPPLRLK